MGLSNGTYDVGILGMREDTLPATLLSIAMQTVLPSRVLLRDRGYTPLCAAFAVRNALDVLNVKGVQTVTWRDVSDSRLGPGRNALVAEGKADVFCFADDDVAWEPNVAQSCLRCLPNHPWVAPLVLTPTNEAGMHGFTAPMDRGAHPQFAYPKPGEPLVIEAGDACSATIFFWRRRWEPDWLKNFPDGVGTDDRVWTTLMGPGRLMRRAAVWHAKHPGNRRIPAGTNDAANDELAKRLIAVRA